MNIFGWWRARRARRDEARILYDRLVAQARTPLFYSALGVPDTTDGRFDMIALHAYIAMQGEMAPAMRQALFDVMFKDLERATREMGVGDLSVPRHVKGMMRAFKGRFFAYESAGDDPEKLADALRRNVYRKAEHIDEKSLSAIVSYVRRSVALMRGGQFMFAEIQDDRSHRQAA